jgi:hypothetical protein
LVGQTASVTMDPPPSLSILAMDQKAEMGKTLSRAELNSTMGLAQFNSDNCQFLFGLFQNHFELKFKLLKFIVTQINLIKR